MKELTRPWCIALGIQDDLQHRVFQGQVAVALLVSQVSVAVFVLLSVHCEKFGAFGQAQKIRDSHQGFHAFFCVHYLLIVKFSPEKSQIPLVIIQKFSVSLVHLADVVFAKLGSIVVGRSSGSSAVAIDLPHDSAVPRHPSGTLPPALLAYSGLCCLPGAPGSALAAAASLPCPSYRVQHCLHRIVITHISSCKIDHLHYRIALVHKYNSVSVLIGKEGTWNIIELPLFFLWYSPAEL